MASPKAFAAGFKLLDACWPHAKLGDNEAQMQAFKAVCKELSDEAWLYAVTEVAKSDREFMPPPGVVRHIGLTYAPPRPRLVARDIEPDRPVDRTIPKKILKELRERFGAQPLLERKIR